MIMNLLNANTENITQLQYEIAVKVLNDWLENTWKNNFDFISELELAKFTSNVILWNGRIRNIRKDLFDELVAIPHMTKEIYDNTYVLQIQFVRNEKGWYLDLSGTWLDYWELSCTVYEWFRSGEKDIYSMFNRRVWSCEKKALQEWYAKLDDYMKATFKNMRKGLALIYDKDIDDNIKAIKELREKIQKMEQEKSKLTKRGQEMMEKMFAMQDDF